MYNYIYSLHEVSVMKKKIIVLVLLILICISLFGCGKSIGIIGGADGETSIYVEEN